MNIFAGRAFAGIRKISRNVPRYFWLRCISLQPESAKPLALLRIGISSILIAQAISVRNYLYPLVGSLGIMQTEITSALTVSCVPRLEWAANLGHKMFNLGEERVIIICFIAYLFFLSLLLLGWQTRITALFAWLFHLAFNTSGVASTYGVHEFTNISLFYCVVMPTGAAWSLDSWLTPNKKRHPLGNALSRRVLQWHMCIIYVASGIEKATGEQWWNGEAIWRALIREDVPVNFSWLAVVPVVAMIACWFTLVVEIGYGVFIWIPATRKIWLALIALLHAGIAVFLGLWFFSATMLIMSYAAFYPFKEKVVHSEEPAA
jgi:hypothetical protein